MPEDEQQNEEQEKQEHTDAAEEQEEQSLERRLIEAAAAGDGAQVAALLQAGAEPAVETEEGVTPLMLAAEAGSAEAVQALLGELGPAPC